MTDTNTDVCIITPGLDDNSLGRTYCIWLLCRAAGWRTRVITLSPITNIWAPLQGSEFASQCESMPTADPSMSSRLRAAIDGARGVIVIKAIPETFGVLASMLAGRTNVIVDIDDPDLEAQTIWLPPRARAGAMRSRRYWAMRRCRRLVRSFDVMVSNPVLQQMYGGTLVPHVREDHGPGHPHVTDRPRVAFVGTAKKHKGIELLRAAVAELAPRGFTLDVTAPAPADARPHETWHGHTSIERGIAITQASDIVAVPSLAGGYARAQFPVKLVDAQLSARPVVASDVGPIDWALDGGGLLFETGSLSGLRDRLAELVSPQLRTRLGQLGRAHALGSYTLDAVLPSFIQALEPRLLATPAA